ncbi:MAG: hypothetical protein R3E39_18655 [Anaerolineae bacterium]
MTISFRLIVGFVAQVGVGCAASRSGRRHHTTSGCLRGDRVGLRTVKNEEWAELGGRGAGQYGAAGGNDEITHAYLHLIVVDQRVGVVGGTDGGITREDGRWLGSGSNGGMRDDIVECQPR